MLLEQVVEASRRISGTSRRLEKIEILADLLRQLHPEEVEIVVAILSGRMRQGRIGVGWETVQTSAAAAAAAAPSLEVVDLDRALEAIAASEGPGSERRRIELLHHLLERATAAEQRFLGGMLVGELRQGALEGIMLESVSKAAGVPLERVRRAAMVAGDLTAVARALLENGDIALDQYQVRVMQPLQPMLAQSADDVEDAIEELGEAALEFKLDGARVQVHKSGGEVVVFSRALNDVTAAVPDVVEAVRALPVRDLILDGEVLSLKPDGRPQPFQITMRRFGRKLDVVGMRAELPLSPFWFDLLYVDGTELLNEPQSRRFQILKEISPAAWVIPNLLASNAQAAREFMEASLRGGHEGIMAKSPGSAYATGARGKSWLKVKQARTLDLVITAAEWGHGRRKGWLSNLHLAARDTEKGGFAPLGKTFKGLTDQMLAWQTEELLKLEIARDGIVVYVEPKLVAEIAFNEIQVSPRYLSGLALRFARVKRYRTDKTAGESDTLDAVRKLAE
jgi:DNA ligase-1